LTFEPTREEVDAVAAGSNATELARQFVTVLNQLSGRLADPALDSPPTCTLVRTLIARLGDDLRMLRESWSGRLPSPPPAEGRPLQSRPDAPLSLLRRQAEAIAEGARMLVQETPNQGSASIPDSSLGPLTQSQHLAAMTLRVQALERQLDA
jgi:hypothetical protein